MHFRDFFPNLHDSPNKWCIFKISTNFCDFHKFSSFSQTFISYKHECRQHSTFSWNLRQQRHLTWFSNTSFRKGVFHENIMPNIVSPKQKQRHHCQLNFIYRRYDFTQSKCKFIDLGDKHKHKHIHVVSSSFRNSSSENFPLKLQWIHTSFYFWCAMQKSKSRLVSSHVNSVRRFLFRLNGVLLHVTVTCHMRMCYVYFYTMSERLEEEKRKFAMDCFGVHCKCIGYAVLCCAVCV